MMKKLILIAAILLTGCGGSSVESVAIPKIKKPVAHAINNDDVYIVAGQSNAMGCDWSYFEHLTGSTTIMIAKSGAGIKELVDDYPKQESLIKDVNAKAILFVHGETDSVARTINYTDQVEEYRLMLGGSPLLISTVGYFKDFDHSLFDKLTKKVKGEAKVNPNWVIAFDDARNFYQWGMLKADKGHFNEDGCMMVMDAMAEATYNLN